MATEQRQAASGGDLEREEALDLYRRVRLIRRFEETVQALFLRGEVHGTTHLYIGQEAVATGVGSVLTPADRVAATYRGHGHALSIGVDPQALLDEMLGRSSGVCGGRAGSMNVIDRDHGLIGSFGIIGGSMSAAVGTALAVRRRGARSATPASIRPCINRRSTGPTSKPSPAPPGSPPGPGRPSPSRSFILTRMPATTTIPSRSDNV